MKRHALIALQAIVSFALIAWIFRDADQRQRMAEALASANLWWFIPGIAAVAVGLALQTCRWQILLRAVGIHLSLWCCGKLLLIGTFFNLFLLGATGGDVVKIYLAIRESPAAKAGAFLSVVVDRIVGVLALTLIAVVVISLRFSEFMATPIARGMMATLVVILGGIISVIVAGATVAAFRLQDRLPQRLPLRNALVEVAVATDRYTRSPRSLLAAIALSIPAHLLFFSSFYFAARAIGARLGLLDTCAVMPIVNTLASLPVSLSGIGVREHAFEQLLASLYQIPSAEAVLISIIGYLMTVFWGLVGGVAFMTYRSGDGRSASFRDIQSAAPQAADAASPAP